MSRLNHVEAFPLLPKAKEKDLPLIRLTFLVSIQRLPDTSLPDIQSSVTVAFIWHFLLSLTPCKLASAWTVLITNYHSAHTESSAFS